LGKGGGKNDTLPTYMWKEKAGRRKEGGKESGKE